MQSHQPIKLAILIVIAIACSAAIPAPVSAQTYPGLKCVIDGSKQCQVRNAAKWHDANVYFASRQAADCFREMTKSGLRKPALTSLILKANHQLALTGQFTQRRCPITGKPVSQAFQTRVAGLKVFLHDSKAQKQLQNIKSTQGRAQLVFADSVFTKTFSLAQKKSIRDRSVLPGANQPVSIADSSGASNQLGSKK